MAKIVFVRHSPSVWNAEKRFTGWEDIPLQEEGKNVLKEVGFTLLEEQYSFDITLTSYLQRSIVSAWIILEAMNLLWIPEVRDWRLNPRHYGVLQGLTHTEAIQQYGGDKIHEIRGSYDVQAPLLTETDERNPRLDPKYAVTDYILPLGESFADVELRVKRCYEDVVIPSLEAGKSMLIVAHEDSLKLLIRAMQHLSTEEMLNLKLPPSKPIVLEYDGQELKRYFL